MAVADISVAPTGDDRRYFKYMSRQTARIVLRQRTLRWSAPGKLNDPFDNQFDLHVDLDMERARELAVSKLWGAYLGVGLPPAGTKVGDRLRDLRNARPDLTRAEFETAIGRGIIESLPRLEQHVRRLQEEIRPHVARHKLLCLALSGTDIPMWSYYAENHHGVVLSFRNATTDSPWLAGEAVRYQREMPRLFDEEGYAHYVSGRRVDPYEIINKIVFTKSDAWAHEREWRIFSGAGRNANEAFEDIPFGSDELEGLTVGCMMPAAEKLEFHELLRQLYPHAEVREVVRHERNFELVVRPLVPG